jgi:hypothetical protein
VTKPEIKNAIEQALKCEKEKKLTVIDLVLSDLNPRAASRNAGVEVKRGNRATGHDRGRAA